MSRFAALCRLPGAALRAAPSSLQRQQRQSGTDPAPGLQVLQRSSGMCPKGLNNVILCQESTDCFSRVILIP